MHLESYMFAFTKLHVCIYKVTIEKVDRACVCVYQVRVSDPRFIQFAVGSCYARVGKIMIFSRKLNKSDFFLLNRINQIFLIKSHFFD